MVVKSATKKKLMDLGIAENFAHTLANDRKWDDVKILTAQEIAQICETDSETSATIRGTIDGAMKKNRASGSEATGPVTQVRKMRARVLEHVLVQRQQLTSTSTMLRRSFVLLMMNSQMTRSSKHFMQQLLTWIQTGLAKKSFTT